MFCPKINSECRTDCVFYTSSGCLIAHHYRAGVKATDATLLMLEQMKPVFLELYGLPEELKQQFPDDLRKLLDDVCRNLDE